MACINCNESLDVLKGKSYRRYSGKCGLKGTDLRVAEGLFSEVGIDLTPGHKTTERSLCGECYRLLGKIIHHRQQLKDLEDEFRARTNDVSYISTKRKAADVTPRNTPRKPKKQCTSESQEAQAQPEKSQGRPGFKHKITESIAYGNYRSTFQLLLQTSEKARRAFRYIVMKEVDMEVKSFARSELREHQELTSENISNFSWDDILTEAEGLMPVLSGVISSVFQRKARKIDMTELSEALLPRIGQVLMTIMYTRFPSTFKLAPAIMSLVLFRHGNPHMVEKSLNHLGISLGVDGTRAAADKVRKEVAVKAESWRQDVEEGAPLAAPLVRTSPPSTVGYSKQPSHHHRIAAANVRRELVPDPFTESGDSSDDEMNAEGDTDDVASLASSEDEEISSQADTYSIIWDNVGKQMKRHHQTAEKGNTYQMFAMTLMVKSRIPVLDLHGLDFNAVAATSLPLSIFLPSQSDWDVLRERMAVMTSRILEATVPALNGVPVCKHITHKYSKESSRKSEMINLGVIDANPGTAKGVVQIMKVLNVYVPMPDGDAGQPLVVCCHGDQLSCERMVDARFAMGDHDVPKHTLKGLEPVPGEFHHRCLRLQDTFDALMNASSAPDRGTLQHIKNRAGQRSAKKRVMDDADHAYQLMDIATHTMVCLALLNNLGLEKLDQVDPGEDAKTWIDEQSRQVVNLVWPEVDTASINKVSAEIDQEPAHEEEVTYCFCKVTQGEIENQEASVMVECSAAERCTKGQWFHIDCVNLTEETIPEGDWFCSDACMPQKKSKNRKKSKKDHVREYQCAMAWQGLYHLVALDAERENDGEMLNRIWRFNMLSFWANNHFKYMILGHRLTAVCHEWLHPMIAADLTHNRTANTFGGRGYNVALDLKCEHSNHDFQAALRAGHGHFSPSHVQRVSHLIGSLGKQIENVFCTAFLKSKIRQGHTHRVKVTDDARKLVKEYSKDQLYGNKPGREHPTFPSFVNHVTVKSPDKLRKRFEKYARNLDAEKQLLEMERD